MDWHIYVDIFNQAVSFLSMLNSLALPIPIPLNGDTLSCHDLPRLALLCQSVHMLPCVFLFDLVLPLAQLVSPLACKSCVEFGL